MNEILCIQIKKKTTNFNQTKILNLSLKGLIVRVVYLNYKNLTIDIVKIVEVNF
jgi:hypothetical protein